MSTAMYMIMDTDALDNEGPFSSHQTSDIIQSGTYSPIQDKAQYDVIRPGVTAPQGGIDYIDQAVGGVSGVREDVSVNGGIGVFSYRSRTQPFNGDYISARITRSEEHTSELQSLMRISYAVFCLKKNNQTSKSSAHN